MTYVIERCKAGDFTGRPALSRRLNTYARHPLTGRAQCAALCVARDEDLLDATNIVYVMGADLAVLRGFAGSGAETLAVAGGSAGCLWARRRGRPDRF